MKKIIDPGAVADQKARKHVSDVPIRMMLRIDPTTRKNLKVKAAQKGMTMKAYMLQLLQDDGVEVKE